MAAEGMELIVTEDKEALLRVVRAAEKIKRNGKDDSFGNRTSHKDDVYDFDCALEALPERLRHE